MQSKSFPGLVKKKKKKELDKAEGCAVGGWINNRRHLMYLTTVCDKTQNKFDNTVSKKAWLCGLNVRWTEDYSRTTTEILYSNVTFIAGSNKCSKIYKLLVEIFKVYMVQWL